MHQRDDEAKPLTSNNDHQTNFIDPSLNSRLGFIRKVYSILSIQLVFTALISFVSITNESIRQFQLENIWLFILALVFSIVFICLLFCCKQNARQVPKNYIYLGCFTLCEAYLVSVICCSCVVQYENGMDIIVMALTMTALMVVGLTMYACTTKEDFTLCGGLLWTLVICLICASIFLIFFQNQIFHIIVTVFAIFIYSLYLLYDTQLIIGGKRYELSMDDYILGSVALYLDIIMLFLEMLKLLSIIFGKH